MAIPYTEVTWNAIIGVPSGQPFQYWLTDFPAAPGIPGAQDMTPYEKMGAFGLPYPLVFITGARIFSQDAIPGASQIELGIDHNNNAYNTGSGSSHQDGSDQSEYENLVSLNGVGAITEASRQYPFPKIWNRTLVGGVPTDRLWLQVDGAGAATIAVQLSFLVPNSAEPTGLTPPAPPAPGWDNSAGPLSMSGNAESYGGYTFAVVVAPSAIASLPAASQTAVTIKAASDSGLVLASLYIGPMAPGGAPTDASSLTALSFSGSPGVTLAAAASAVASAACDIDPTHGYVIKGYVTSGGLGAASGVSGWQNYFTTGNSAATLTGSYAAGSVSSVGVSLVQKLIP